MTAALIIFSIIAAIGAFYLGRQAGARTAQAEISRLSSATAAAEATLAEVRARLESRERELAQSQEALLKERSSVAEINARLESAREHFAEQRKQLEQMDVKIRETFTALSATALQKNNEQFVLLAEAKMKPLREQLERYETQIKSLETVRAEAYGGLNERLETMQQFEQQLSRETRQLVSALRQPGTKGKWGEVSLRNLVELTGMSSYCDFDEQASLQGEEGRLRPDMIVRLPGGRTLVIDAKVNASAYLDSLEATDEEQRKRLLTKYISDVRSTMRALAAKEYVRALGSTPEFVVMFMPGEAFFGAALSNDNTLIEEGMKNRVLLASPTSLAALLMAIRHGWQQHQLAENAEEIARVGRELFDRLCTFAEHFESVRAGIEGAAKAYNKAIGNWETRTMPAARRLKDLDVASATKEIAELSPTQVPLRSLFTDAVDPADAA